MTHQRTPEAVRPSQLQVRAFASSQLQPKAGDWFVNRQQTPSDMSQLISLMDSKSELVCSDSLPLSKEVGS